MKTPGREGRLALLQARRQQIEQELQQLERHLIAARLQVVTLQQRIARLDRSSR